MAIGAVVVGDVGAVALAVGGAVGVVVAVGGAVGVVVAVAVEGRPEVIHDEWRHRAHAADDLLTDIAAVCRGDMPAEPREGGSEAHRAAWVAVCALRSEVAAERAARDEARRMLAECYVLSGADTDGNTPESGWVHLWRGAVEEVRQLRADYDDHSDIERAERERDEAQAEVSLLQQEARIRRHISDGLAAEVAAERAAVVAWLRDEVDDDDNAEGPLASILAYAANAVENGEHRREGDE